MSETPNVIVNNRSGNGCLGYLLRGCGCLVLLAVGLIVAGFIFGWDWWQQWGKSSDTRAIQKTKEKTKTEEAPRQLDQVERMRRELPAAALDKVAPVNTEMKNAPKAGDESFFK